MATKEQVLQMLKDSNYRIAPFWCEEIKLYVFVNKNNRVFARENEQQEWKHMKLTDDIIDHLIEELEKAKHKLR